MLREKAIRALAGFSITTCTARGEPVALGDARTELQVSAIGMAYVLRPDL